jgi:hypothetical protein
MHQINMGIHSSNHIKEIQKEEKKRLIIVLPTKNI